MGDIGDVTDIVESFSISKKYCAFCKCGPLYKALINRDFHGFFQMLQDGEDPNEIIPGYPGDLLIFSLYHLDAPEKWDVIKALLNHGVDVHQIYHLDHLQHLPEDVLGILMNSRENSPK